MIMLLLGSCFCILFAEYLQQTNHKEDLTESLFGVIKIWRTTDDIVIVDGKEPLDIDARIHLIGKVMDMNNRELEDVTLKLEFNRPKDFGLKSEHLRETGKINGSFAIEKNHYTSVSILFQKAGYRTEDITFYTSEATNTPQSAIQENCHIKLREIGTLAELVEGHAHLEYDEER